METELTKRQIQQQDRVDNQIYAMLDELASHAIPDGKHIRWNIEDISQVRELVWSLIVDNSQNHPDWELDEQKFYPYIEEDEELVDESPNQEIEFDDTEDEDSFERDWCDFCVMSCIADGTGNCPHCGNPVNIDENTDSEEDCGSDCPFCQGNNIDDGGMCLDCREHI